MKKAQIGLGETIAVLIVFIILISFGFIWYVQYQTGKIEEQAQRAYELKSTQILTYIESLPEIKCSSESCSKCGGTDTSYSFDYYKVNSSYNTISNNLPYYIKILGLADIKLEIVDPRFPTHDLLIDRPKTLTIYNFTSKNSKGSGFQLPVTVYDPISDFCYMGTLDIIIYQ